MKSSNWARISFEIMGICTCLRLLCECRECLIVPDADWERLLALASICEKDAWDKHIAALAD